MNIEKDKEQDISQDDPVWSCNHVTRSCVVYVSQLLIALIVIIVSLFNLSRADQSEKREIWISLLCSCVGYILPSPSLQPGNTKISK